MLSSYAHWPNLTLLGELAIINRHYECAAHIYAFHGFDSAWFIIALANQYATIGIDEIEINCRNTEFHTWFHNFLLAAIAQLANARTNGEIESSTSKNLPKAIPFTIPTVSSARALFYRIFPPLKTIHKRGKFWPPRGMHSFRSIRKKDEHRERVREKK